ncbi:MAG TPA: sodium/solute symporter [Acidobacteriaceae bacterium]|nr:sodium/solute symporter [Acidobacteriaceae bacterium]
MPMRLHAVDLGVVALYLVAITAFGLRFGRSAKKNAASAGGAKEKTLRAYFLADRTAPWWAIALSIVSAETSTLTIIGTPGLAFAGDLGFLQIVLGYMCGRVVVALLFLPKYFRGEMLTAYQLIDRRFSREGRFGTALYKVTAGLFLMTRAAAEGVRVFAVSIVVGIAIGTGDVLSIAIIAALTLLYTFEGGMAAVIWTDVVQMAIYVGGTLVAIWSLGQHVPGGWSTIHTLGAAAGKFHMLNFAMNLTTAYTFWAGVLGGTFLTMASHGTDQLMVQRMLAARNLKESRLALLSSGVVIFVQFALFLLIGVGLWVFYGMHPEALAAIGGANGNRIFPGFIVAEMPVGVAGLLVAAILAAAMSNLSAALNSLSSSTVVDFYMGWRPGAQERERMLVSRASTVIWGGVLFAVAVYAVRAGGKGNVVEIGLSIASVAYGCLLGVFLLGTLTKFATQSGAIAGMVCGFAVNLMLWRWPDVIGLHVAWTWYVLIGAGVTFAVGSAASGVLRRREVVVAAAVLLGLVFSGSSRAQQAQPVSQGLKPASSVGLTSGLKPGPISETIAAATYDFSAVSSAIGRAIEAGKLPGAVGVVGHGGRVVFERAYGVRKLAGEPGLDGKPSTAEPMTVDTIFDMASLTKCMVTATAIMQLAEQGKVDVDAPVVKYLPEFGVNGKDKVTVRELLTHYSGLPPDVDLTDEWGLARPDKAEGIRRAMSAKLESAPGTKFVYSDINFVALGALVEKIGGERLDEYAADHIFAPLQMSRTQYHPFDRACGPRDISGAAIIFSIADSRNPQSCLGSWTTDTLHNTAPTQHDDQGTAATNPNFDRLLRGTVHDPTVRRMGGVAGQAGVFSTADDIAKFAQALLDKLLRNAGAFPLKQATLQAMTRPQQPGTAVGGATIFKQDGTTTTGIALRGFGWDINSAYSRPRGTVFATAVTAKITSGVAPSFGHTGYTGTSLWIDPASDTYVVLLANSVHPRGGASISPLRGEVATNAGNALGLGAAIVEAIHGDDVAMSAAPVSFDGPHVKTGIDVLEADGFKELKAMAARHGGRLRVGLLTNQTGVDAGGRRTIDVLRGTGGGVELARLFSPEHGLLGAKDSEHIGQEVDGASGIAVKSLYGPKDSDKRPKLEDLTDLDLVVIDLQDAGVRFYTYETVMGYFLEAARSERERGHALEVMVLDRPAMTGGLAVQGPVSDTPASYINYMPEPVRSGMTLGELAGYMQHEVGGSNGASNLTVIKMIGWRRGEFFDETGVRWVNPSPNLRSVSGALLYPGLGMLDFTNVSVGRGTTTPFEVFGAEWIEGKAVAKYLTARNIPGVKFEATRFAVADSAEKYPGHGQTIEGVRIAVTDRLALDSPEMGIEILAALHHLYPKEFQLQKAIGLVANKQTMAALGRGEDPRTIAAVWSAGLAEFEAKREKYLLY